MCPGATLLYILGRLLKTKGRGSRPMQPQTDRALAGGAAAASTACMLGLLKPGLARARA